MSDITCNLCGSTHFEEELHDCPQTHDKLMARIEELEEQIEELKYQLQQSIWDGLSKEKKDESIRMNSQ